jgi:acetyltransferase-like isoleucine patch superfamily enzyme
MRGLRGSLKHRLASSDTLLRHALTAARLARDVRIRLRWAARKAQAQSVVSVGAGTYATRPPKVYIYAHDPPLGVTIGAYCSIGDNVEFLLGANHDTSRISTYPFHRADRVEDLRGSIRIGNDVWIGKNVTILEGVTIGDGAVVGANAVVARDVRPYAIVVGNPAHEIRRRFADEEIDELQRIAWWSWPEAEVRAAAEVLTSGDIARLRELAWHRRRDRIDAAST